MERCPALPRRSYGRGAHARSSKVSISSRCSNPFIYVKSSYQSTDYKTFYQEELVLLKQNIKFLKYIVYYYYYEFKIFLVSDWLKGNSKCAL